MLAERNVEPGSVAFRINDCSQLRWQLNAVLAVDSPVILACKKSHSPFEVCPTLWESWVKPTTSSHSCKEKTGDFRKVFSNHPNCLVHGKMWWLRILSIPLLEPPYGVGKNCA